MRVRLGRLLSPGGMEFVGAQISIGGIADPAGIKRTYEDIERILHSNKQPYKEVETRTEQGTFKSFVIEA